MDTWCATLAAAVLLLCAQTPATAADAAVPSERPLRFPGAPVANQYVVTLTDAAATDRALTALGVQPRFVYRSALHGFTAALTDAQVQATRAMPGVVSIAKDSTLRVQAFAASWGLDRIDQRDLPLDHTFAVNHDGATVTAYVIDTGIDVTHPDFGGRASIGHDSVGDGFNGADCNGHGTHVAGTVGGTTSGVAKQVRLVAVRVFDCTGSGAYSQIIDGIDWVSANAVKPAVVNMSFAGPVYQPLDDAANQLAAQGVFASVAAGNQADDSCRYSPARAAGVFTIGATTREDGFAPYSNHGPCTQLLAPGTEITSDVPGGGVAVLNGTSMAAPHVTGVAALYKQAYGDADQFTVQNWFWDHATAGRINLLPPPPDTANLLLHAAGL